MSEPIEKKYEFTGETKEVEGHTLHRIRAVRSFGSVKKGDLGGWIESENNLSHMGDCWVSGDALVYGEARVCERAKVYENALVYGNAFVCGDAKVFGNAQVYDKAYLLRNAEVYGNAAVFDNARVSGNAKVYGYAQVYGDAWVYWEAQVYGSARVYGDAQVYGNATICGYASVYGLAVIMGDAKVERDEDYTVVKNFWSSCRYITYTRSNGMWKVGCFYGTGEELIEKAYKDSEEKGKCYADIVKVMESISSFLAQNVARRKGNA